VTLDVPAGTPPGDYSGVIRVAPAGRPDTEIPLRVRVWGFALPDTPSLRAWSRFNPQLGPLNLTDLGNYEAFFKDYSRYKQGLDGAAGEISIFKHADGGYRFDFSELDRYFEIAFRYGSRSFNMAQGWHDELRGWLSGQGKLPRITLPDGRTEELRLFPPGDPRIGNNWLHISKRWAEAPFEEPMRPIYSALLKAIAAHWKEKGWYPFAHFEALDEPAVDDFYLNQYRKRKALVPDLPLMSFGIGASVYNIGLNTVWAPALRDLPASIGFMRERKARGETLFTYICGGIVWNQNRNSPDVYVWEAPVDRRVLGWMCWKWRLDGCFMFVSNLGWNGYRSLQPNDCGTWNPWPYESDRSANVSPEVNQFIYLHESSPGQWNWLPSVRLENWRDGVEDYEYLRLVERLREQLSRFTGKIDESKRKQLLDQSQAMLNLEALIPGDDIFAWEQDWRAFEARRQALGEWIAETAGIVDARAGE
ncbi:MAG: DUF4091 domain-containing protein, partial [Kiritimatiellae bacterium]|nr:DUF4091 domain-containing protein [Kiritimatiellia bacterium]